MFDWRHYTCMFNDNREGDVPSIFFIGMLDFVTMVTNRVHHCSIDINGSDVILISVRLG